MALVVDHKLPPVWAAASDDHVKPCGSVYELSPGCTRTLNTLVVSASVAVLETPFSAALSVTVALIELVATAANCALAAPERTETEAGTTTAVLLLLSVTGVAAVAAALSVTVHEVDVAPVIDVGVHVTAVSVGAVTVERVIVAVCENPPKVAVTVAVAALPPLLVAVNVAVLAPDATVTDAGTFSAALLLLNDTAVAAAAAALSVTVQVLDAAPERVVGLHVTELRIGVEIAPTVTVPPVPPRGNAIPDGEDATPFVIVSDDVRKAAILMLAAMPSAIGVEFVPYATQVYHPVDAAHVSVFPAAVNTAPAVAVMEEMSIAEY